MTLLNCHSSFSTFYSVSFSFLAHFSYPFPNLFFIQWKNISPEFLDPKKKIIYFLSNYSLPSDTNPKWPLWILPFSSGWELCLQRAPPIPPGNHGRWASWYSEEKTGSHQGQWVVGPALFLAPCLALVHTGPDGFYLYHVEVWFRLNNFPHPPICPYPNPRKLCYFIWQKKKDFADVMRLRNLRWRDYLTLSAWTWCSTGPYRTPINCPYKRDPEGVRQRRRQGDDGSPDALMRFERRGSGHRPMNTGIH